MSHAAHDGEGGIALSRAACFSDIGTSQWESEAPRDHRLETAGIAILQGCPGTLFPHANTARQQNHFQTVGWTNGHCFLFSSCSNWPAVRYPTRRAALACSPGELMRWQETSAGTTLSPFRYRIEPMKFDRTSYLRLNALVQVTSGDPTPRVRQAAFKISG